MSESRRIRVLHVFHSMDRGGAETWIVNVFRHIDRERFQFDFLLESNRPGAYDAEIQALGGNLYYAGSPTRLHRFAAAFRRTARRHGPYDAIHSHVHHSSGIMLTLAAWQGIPVRIAHSHSDIRGLQEGASQIRQMYFRNTEMLIRRYATGGLAASADAAVSLFGKAWEQDQRFRVMHCGIDLGPYERRVDRKAVRARLGIAPNAFVIGHVGRFMPMKNHAFLVDVFAQVHAQRQDARLLLVGDGPQRGEIEQKVRCLGLEDVVVFAGVQSTIPELLKGGMDCFVFPSTYEGLGLAVVEAQAAGLPCIVSTAVPQEATVDADIVTRLNLEGGLAVWATEVVRSALPAVKSPGRAKPVEIVRLSDFNVERSTSELSQIYGYVERFGERGSGNRRA